MEALGDLHELRVQLHSEADPTQGWEASFNDDAMLHYREARREPWGAVTLLGSTIIVQDLEPGAEQALSTYLKTLVEADRSARESRNGAEARSRAHKAPKSAGEQPNAWPSGSALCADVLHGRRSAKRPTASARAPLRE
jgi:hypothetical protein